MMIRITKPQVNLKINQRKEINMSDKRNPYQEQADIPSSGSSDRDRVEKEAQDQANKDREEQQGKDEEN